MALEVDVTARRFVVRAAFDVKGGERSRSLG
jgi:hypothetical protein